MICSKRVRACAKCARRAPRARTRAAQHARTRARAPRPVRAHAPPQVRDDARACVRAYSKCVRAYVRRAALRHSTRGGSLNHDLITYYAN
jgi:hypothetical protein